MLWSRIFVTVPAGHRGVMFYRFGSGTLTERSFGEGLYIIAPWNKLTVYETRLQSRTLLLKVPSEEGLEMAVSVSLRYRPSVESLGYLHQDIGPDYFDRLLLPEVHSHLRKILGKRKAQDIYTGAREVLEELSQLPVLGRLRREKSDGGPPQEPHSGAPYLLLEELRVLDIVRPQAVADAVNEKQRQEQLSLEYKHRLQREAQESERKRVEAAGIRDFKSISGADILRWRGIDATFELARSSNAKVVVLGNNQGALPMMLNLGEEPARSSQEATQAPARKTAPVQNHEADSRHLPPSLP